MSRAYTDGATVNITNKNKWCYYHQRCGSEALHAFGKYLGRPSAMASAIGQKHHLLYICDHHLGQRFLVDTRAEISVLPSSFTDIRSGKKGPILTPTPRSPLTSTVAASSRPLPLPTPHNYCLASISSRHTHYLTMSCQRWSWS